MYYQNVIYHVYNHTNNKELLFLEDKDFERFKRKLKRHLLPVADVLCYCLMPTHFHLQMVVKSTGLQASKSQTNQQVIHECIRTMLSSYVRYFNAKYERRGSLLRSGTKAKAAYTDFIPEDYELLEDIPFTQLIPYVRTCFRYIHRNPTAAGLVDSPEKWEHSSAIDYLGLRDEKICNYELAERLLGIQRQTR